MTSDESIVLIQYLLCFKHIGLLKSKRTITDFSYIFRQFGEMATDIMFSSIWVGFGLHFGRFFEGIIVKIGNKKTIEKHTCKKVMRVTKRSRGVTKEKPLSSPKRTFQITNKAKALETLPWCLAARWRITESY